jgi:hypothetical protein
MEKAKLEQQKDWQEKMFQAGVMRLYHEDKERQRKHEITQRKMQNEIRQKEIERDIKEKEIASKDRQKEIQSQNIRFGIIGLIVAILAVLALVALYIAFSYSSTPAGATAVLLLCCSALVKTQLKVEINRSTVSTDGSHTKSIIEQQS